MSNQSEPIAPSIASHLVVQTAQDFRVSLQAYTDPDIFAEEIRKIFDTTWVYVAHASEIPSPGSFKTGYLGLRPILITRDLSGMLHVFLNQCRHRGTLLCHQEKGDAQRFQCPYHGWVYAADGRLVGIAQRKGGYPETWDLQDLGLIEVPRVASYRGLIFASMSPHGPTLLEHLGRATEYLDRHFDRSPIGEIDLRWGAHRAEYPGNWKLQAENTTDGYHGNYVHESFWMIQAAFGGEDAPHGNYVQSTVKEIKRFRDQGCTRGFEFGHGILEYLLTESALAALFQGPHHAYFEKLQTHWGAARFRDIMTQENMLIFPNVAVILDQIRVIRPITVDRTEVTLYPFALQGVPDAVNEWRLRGYERFFGPASFGSPDDVEIFGRNQLGFRANPESWAVLSRGLEREYRNAAGEWIGHPSDETPQRAFYREWMRLMQ